MGAQLGDEVVVRRGRATWCSSRGTSGTPSGTRAHTTCRLLEIISPAGFEHFFNELVGHGRRAERRARGRSASSASATGSRCSRTRSRACSSASASCSRARTCGRPRRSPSAGERGRGLARPAPRPAPSSTRSARLDRRVPAHQADSPHRPARRARARRRSRCRARAASGSGRPCRPGPSGTRTAVSGASRWSGVREELEAARFHRSLEVRGGIGVPLPARLEPLGRATRRSASCSA